MYAIIQGVNLIINNAVSLMFFAKKPKKLFVMVFKFSFAFSALKYAKISLKALRISKINAYVYIIPLLKFSGRDENLR